MIEARIVADSVSSAGRRITSLVLRYPRFIHSEFMTHRLFSRNASSSRAIPVKKMLAQVLEDPALPIHWGANMPGMQAREQLQGFRAWAAKTLFLLARYPAVVVVWSLTKLGLHKQVANRLLEPWLHIQVLVTATEWGNFFNLRCHPDAQPEMQALAECIFQAMAASSPKLLAKGQWHLPFLSDSRYLPSGLQTFMRPHLLQELSAARCARVSYTLHDGAEPTIGEDLALYGKLMANGVKHASPTEHQATPADNPDDRSGNFVGWVQFRKLIPGEYMPEFKEGQ